MAELVREARAVNEGLRALANQGGLLEAPRNGMVRLLIPVAGREG